MNGIFASLISTTGQPIDGAALGALLTAQAGATPDAPALTIGAHSLSFAELESRANRRARQLACDFSVSPGDRVVLAMPNRSEFIETAYAIWKLGAVPCPVSSRMAPAEFAGLIELIAPRCVVRDRHAPATPAASLDIDLALPGDISDTPLPPIAATPGKIMNSGGSTGRPKLIIDPMPSIWGADKEGRSRPARITLLVPAPLHHSAPFAYATLGIAQGSHAVCLEKFDPAAWIAAVERYRPSLAYLVPTMMNRIAKLPVEQTQAADLTSITTLLHMAAICPVAVKRWWIDRLGPDKVVEVYGGTERIGATVITGREWLARPGSVGRAVPGDQIVMLDANGRPLPHGEIGEIFFHRDAGPGTAYAYIGAPTRIRDGLDSFGDMGWLDAEGWLYIADRRTDMVVIGGVNVFPAEIEAAIETLPDVLCAAVIGLPDEDLGSRLHAIVELAADAMEPVDGMAYLAPALAMIGGHKRPRSVEFTRAAIRDDSGKVRRSRLREERLPLA